MPEEKSKEDEVTTEKVQVNMASAETPKSIREDQVNNAVAFLTHPKVRDSTEESKKTFLESKGLTEEEIEEAFQRVGINQPTQVSQAPSKPWEKGGNVVTTVVQEKQPIRWSQVVLGAGAIGASLYAAKYLLEPYVKKFIQSAANSTPDKAHIAEEQKRVDFVVSELRTQTNELQNSVDSLKKMFMDLEDTVSDYKTAGNNEDVGDLREELKSLASTINQFASPAKTYESTLKDELSAIKSILSDIARSPHSGMEPDNSSQEASPLLKSAVGSSMKTSQNGSVPLYTHEADSEANAQGSYPSPAEPSSSVKEGDSAPRPHSYMEILEMLEKNQTPPGIRTDIDDKVKVPNQTPTESSAELPLKPWERSASTFDNQVGVVQEIEAGGSWRPPPVPTSRIY